MLLGVPYLRPLQRYSDLQQSSFEHLQHISRQLQSDLDCLAQVDNLTSFQSKTAFDMFPSVLQC